MDRSRREGRRGRTAHPAVPDAARRPARRGGPGPGRCPLIGAPARPRAQPDPPPHRRPDAGRRLGRPDPRRRGAPP
ncbi:hypothetical protein PL81_17385, partial [Streptomyces sp. RSD-27]